MKKLSIILLMLLGIFVTQVQAKTIHWLTFIDTTDPNVGQIDQNTRKILYARWIDIVNASLSEQGYNVNKIDVYGSSLSPEKCKNVVNDLDCDADDIVVFYYVGHGTENTKTSKYPLMLMGVELNTAEAVRRNLHRLMPLSWVHDTLKKKGARLTITIGMCCNGRQGAPGRAAPNFSVNYGNAYIDDETSNAIRKMFLDYKGDLIITSSSPDESSYAPYYETPLGLTDYFTYYLIVQFNNVLPSVSNPNWETMLKEIRNDVKESVMNDYGESQTAIWTPNITSASRPKKTTPTPPTPGKDEIKRQDDKTIMKTELDKVLSFVSSTNVDELQRIAAIEKIKPAFADNLTVRIMSQDGNVVVDRESISTFLGRIATSRLLMNVSVVDFSVNQNGQISSLRVREVYKKK